MGAQAARESACIKAGDGHGAFALEISVQGFMAAEIGRQEGQVFDDQASCMNAIGLHVFAVGAGVANVRVREGDDLSAVTGIGEDFLVAGQRGVEDDFARGVTRGADGNPGKDRAVGERDKGFRVDGQHGNLQKKGHSQADLDTRVTILRIPRSLLKRPGQHLGVCEGRINLGIITGWPPRSRANRWPLRLPR